MKPKVSLLISTYNWPEALELVLLSVKQQKYLPDEVLIADDGSGPETKELIDGFRKDFPVPLIHEWIPDDGFRKTIVLNRAFARAKFPYLIQIDGDCIMHPYFVKDHVDFARKGTYVQGSRLYMSKEKSQGIMMTKNIRIKWWSGGMINAESGMRSRFLRWLMSFSEAKLKKVRGANMAFWKDDFVQINGYNEEMTGWGSEDWELAQRLRNIGLFARRLKYGAVLFHLFHEELSRERCEINAAIFDKTHKQKVLRCDKGVDQYINSL